MQASQQAIQKHYWECPECHSRFFSEPLTLGARNGQLIKIHPVCSECFSKCPQGHEFGYGENCNKCGAPRRRFNLVRHLLPLNDPNFGVETTGSTSYPTETFGKTGTGGSSDEGGVAGTNKLRACKFVLSKPITAKKITVYWTNVSGSYNCYTSCSIYNDSSGYPNAEQVESGVQNVQAGGWRDYTVSATFLDTGTYWLNTNTNVADATIGKMMYDTGTANQTYTITGSYGGSSPNSPSTFPGSATGQARDYSIYVQGCAVKGYAKAYISTLSEVALVTSVSFYSHATGNARVAIYSVSGGAPSALQWQSGSVALSASAWKTVNISEGTPVSVALVAGDYAFAWQVDTANDAPSYAAGTATYGNYVAQTYGTFPSTWTGGTATAEKWSEYATYTQGDMVSASDSIGLSDAVTVQDSDSVTASDSIGLSESVSLSDADSVTVADEIKVAEFAWHMKDSIMVGSFDLPHVQSIKITDPAAMSDRKIEGGSLPFRKMLGKPGRVVELEGWTTTQTDVDDMSALKDGAAKVFLHPSGDSFAVLVTAFDADRAADEYDRRVWRMTLAELRTW